MHLNICDNKIHFKFFSKTPLYASSICIIKGVSFEVQVTSSVTRRSNCAAYHPYIFKSRHTRWFSKDPRNLIIRKVHITYYKTPGTIKNK